MKYPKLLAVTLSFIAAFVLFELGLFDFIAHHVSGYGYITALLAGMLFSISITSAFGIALLIELSQELNPLLEACIAGVGSLLIDMIIFSFVRFSLHDELQRMFRSRLVKWMRSLWPTHPILERLRPYFLWSVAGLIIASPFPDEIAISLLSTVRDVKGRWFTVFCFAVNTVGILVIIGISRTIGV